MSESIKKNKSTCWFVFPRRSLSCEDVKKLLAISERPRKIENLQCEEISCEDVKKLLVISERPRKIENSLVEEISCEDVREANIRER